MRASRQRSVLASRLLKEKETKFAPLDLHKAEYVPPGMTKAFKNNRYTVMIYENQATTAGFATRVMVQNHFNKPIENHWSEMNRIKNEIFGEETVAIEYYPQKSKLLDTHNIYWMWIYPTNALPVPIINL